MRPYTDNPDDVTAEFPTAPMTIRPRRNGIDAGFAVTETGTAPAAPNFAGGRRVLQLDYTVARYPAPVVTVGGQARAVVPFSGVAPATGQVAIAFSSPLLEVAGADAGATVSIAYTALGSAPTSDDDHKLQKELRATQVALLAGGGGGGGITNITGDTEIVVTGSGASRTLALGVIDGGKIDDGTIQSTAYSTGSVGTDALGDGQVTTDKLTEAIVADIITGVGAATGAVDGARLTAGSVATAAIADEAVTDSKLDAAVLNAINTATDDAAAAASAASNAQAGADAAYGAATAAQATADAAATGTVNADRLDGFISGSRFGEESIPASALNGDVYNRVLNTAIDETLFVSYIDTSASGSVGFNNPERHSHVIIDMGDRSGTVTANLPEIGTGPTQSRIGRQMLVTRYDGENSSSNSVVFGSLSTIIGGAIELGGNVCETVWFVATGVGWMPIGRFAAPAV